jgi:hypothetical protein
MSFNLAGLIITTKIKTVASFLELNLCKVQHIHVCWSFWDQWSLLFCASKLKSQLKVCIGKELWFDHWGLNLWSRFKPHGEDGMWVNEGNTWSHVKILIRPSTGVEDRWCSFFYTSKIQSGLMLIQHQIRVVISILESTTSAWPKSCMLFGCLEFIKITR